MSHLLIALLTVISVVSLVWEQIRYLRDKEQK